MQFFFNKDKKNNANELFCQNNKFARLYNTPKPPWSHVVGVSISEDWAYQMELWFHLASDDVADSDSSVGVHIPICGR